MASTDAPSLTWPDGARAAFALTFDVDAEEGYLSDDPANEHRPTTLSIGAFGIRVGLPSILDLLQRRGLPATFFVPGRTAERHDDAIRRVVDAGHELAGHGHTHRSPARLTAAEQAEEFTQMRRVLDGYGVPVTGYRAPAWDLGSDTLSMAAANGFTYSSNLMDDIRPYRHADTGLIELPIAWPLDDAPHFWFDEDTWLRKMATPSEAREIWQSEFEGIRQAGGLCVLTMHPEVIGRPSRMAMLDGFVEHVTGIGDVWIATCAEIAGWASAHLPD